MNKQRGMDSGRWMAVFSFCLTLFWSVNGLTAASAATDNCAPLAKVQKTVLDLGKAEEGDMLRACFPIHNDGNAELRIHKVKSRCGCTRVDYPQAIAPAKRAQICLNIDTLGSHGRRTFKTTIHCNDPSRKVFSLHVRAQIAPMVTLTPDRVFFRGLSGGDFQQDIRIGTKGKSPLKVQLDSHTLGEKITVNIEPVVAGKAYRFTVQNRLSAAGTYRGRIILRSNHPGRERIVVPVFAHLTPPVAVYPSRLVLDTGRCPACRAKGRYKGKLIVRAHDQKPLRIRAVSPEMEGFTCEVKSMLPERAYRLQFACTLKKERSLPPKVTIETDRDDVGVISVPVVLKN